jgi:transposase
MLQEAGAIEEVPMTIIGGLDVHRAQITFDYVDTESGEVSRGRIQPATRTAFRKWLTGFGESQDMKLAVEGCTGWRFLVEEMQRAGIEAHLAEPADTAGLRGPKRRAKTDRADARLLRELLTDGRLPESWIPPARILEVRALARTYLSLSGDRQAWQQRIHAQLYHQGVPSISALLTSEGQARLAKAEVSAAGRQVIETALTMIEALGQQMRPLKAQLETQGRQLPGPRALTALYGIGPLTAAVIWAELGDCRRFRRADQVVRLAGLDITVWASDSKRAAGHLAKQGAPALRWALYEAALTAARPSSPDHEYYRSVHSRLKGKRAVLSVARKLVRHCYHILRELGDEALAETAGVSARAA